MASARGVRDWQLLPAAPQHSALSCLSGQSSPCEPPQPSTLPSDTSSEQPSCLHAGRDGPTCSGDALTRGSGSVSGLLSSLGPELTEPGVPHWAPRQAQPGPASGDRLSPVMTHWAPGHSLCKSSCCILSLMQNRCWAQRPETQDRGQADAARKERNSRERGRGRTISTDASLGLCGGLERVCASVSRNSDTAARCSPAVSPARGQLPAEGTFRVPWREL